MISLHLLFSNHVEKFRSTSVFKIGIKNVKSLGASEHSLNSMQVHVALWSHLTAAAQLQMDHVSKCNWWLVTRMNSVMCTKESWLRRVESMHPAFSSLGVWGASNVYRIQGRMVTPLQPSLGSIFIRDYGGIIIGQTHSFLNIPQVNMGMKVLIKVILARR